MKSESPVYGEAVLKEYPNSTRWIEGRRLLGEGNLILTNKRLVFLNRVVISERQNEKMKELEGSPINEILDFALTLHKRNFQIPLSSIVAADRHRFALLPFPRFCLRLTYLSGSRQKEKTLVFIFTIPVLKGFFQLEITIVMGWVRMIRKVLKARQYGLGRVVT